MRCSECKNSIQINNSNIHCNLKNESYHNDFICKEWMDKDGKVEKWEKELLKSLQIVNYDLWLTEKKQVRL